MTQYREILRLSSLGITQQRIADSCKVSKKTVNRVLKRAKEINIAWPFEKNCTEAVIAEKLFPSAPKEAVSQKRMPDFDYIRKELLHSGVTKMLLWAEYVEECKRTNEDALMYSQFCHYIRLNEQKYRAAMHINRKPAEQIEVDWAGEPASVTNPDTGEVVNAYLFVGVMSYSQYPYVEAFPNMKQNCWITAHVHMYEYFGGVTRILVPDNCKTAVRSNNGWEAQINRVYHEMAEHYGTAIIPARIRSPKDKPNVEGTVGNVTRFITAALRKERFFSFGELNRAIRKKVEEFSRKPFQKKEGSRYELFYNEEMPLLGKLPDYPYEIAEWKQATVLFNYHVSVEGMNYSVPYEYTKHKVDVRITETTVEVFSADNRIASHRRLYGRKGQYATLKEHMPEEHRNYLEWNGDRFRRWAEKIGENCAKVVSSILESGKVEQQGYRSCLGLLKLSEKYSRQSLEAACAKSVSMHAAASYKGIKNILSYSAPSGAKTLHNTYTESSNTLYRVGKTETQATSNAVMERTDGTDISNSHAITRGADYYRREK